MKAFTVDIQGHNKLKRDITTGAIISTDNDGYDAFVKTYDAKIRDIEQMRNLSEKYEALETKVNKILKLLEERL